LLTYDNAPALGQGVGVLLGGRNTDVPSEKLAQIQVLSSRLGLSRPLAGVVLGLLREEPWK
jgi:hypothetical protein